jgi:hypothetical protein
MVTSIAINGTRLDRVKMLLDQGPGGCVSYLLYPKSQIRCSRGEGTLRLVVPPFLSVELYRLGILPQDVTVAVAISIGGRPVGRYVVSEVRYPYHQNLSFGGVIFTFVRVARAAARKARATRRPRAGGGTYVMDITHFLDEAGEIAPLPGPARKLASFLALLIEAATGAPVAVEHDSGIRCRKRSCRGTIRTVRPPDESEIAWHCPACGHHGVIRNWGHTKWNQARATEGPT